MFRIWVSQAEMAYDKLIVDMTNRIIQMRALGIPDDEIFRRLNNSLNNGMDEFGTFKGAWEKAMDDMIGTVSQIESNSVFEGSDTKLVWELDPTAQEHCVDCLRNAKDAPKTFAEWEQIGLPGFGNTECGEYCKCSLEEVTVGVE
jgi:hypothetical protein